MVGLLVMVALGLRLPLLPGYLENHDAANFALALDHFDLALARPHFPGYPVYLGLATALAALGSSAPVALALPGTLAAGLATGVLFLTLRRRAGRGAAAMVAGLYAVLPGIWLADITATSDGLGLHVATLALCGLVAAERSRRAALAAAGLLGLLMGIRASYFPIGGVGLAFLLAGAREWRLRGAIVATAGVATAAWAIPLVVLAGGAARLWEIGGAFVAGHVNGWGGTVASAGWHGRLGQLAENLVFVALGPVATAALAGLAVFALTGRAGRPPWRIALVAGAYLVWVVLGQNPERARHWLPLLPALLLLLAPAAGALLARGRALRIAAALVCAAVLATSLGPTVTHATVLPSGLQGLAWITRHHGPEQLQIYAGDEAGLFRYYAPAYRTARLAEPGQLRERHGEHGMPGKVLITSNAPREGGLWGRIELAARFERSPRIDGPEGVLYVYELLEVPR